MIVDDDDFAGTKANIVETPILTLNDDLSMIYPFVTQIWLTEHDGSTAISEAAPGQTVDVHVSFNRDMDTTVQPSITYGGEDPFTDYTVSGNWTSARTWVGTTKISAVATGGNMSFRAKGGHAADDHWLVCGTDAQRFQFTVNAASAQSAVLNAAGGAGKVTLTWIQNDYELLAGYNLYRSTKADSGFTKLNNTVLTGTSYEDTDVASGVTYYYYFTMVNTDGEEIPDAKSNTASAAPLDDVNPTVTHTPITSARVGQAITLSAEAADNIAVNAVTLFYRVQGAAGAYQSIAMTYNSATGRYGATIPASAVTASGVQYYIEARDAAGNTATAGSAAIPYTINTDSRPTLLAVTPSVVNRTVIPESMTIYGTNFSNGMTVKVGTAAITNYTVKSDGTEITFVTPELSVGAYAISVTKDGVEVSLASAVVYQDSSSYVQLNSGEGTPGVVLRLPLYAVMSGPMYALRAEIDVSSTYFSAASATAAEGFDGQIQKSWSNGTLTISMISAQGVTVDGTDPIAWVELTPRTVDAPTNVQLSLKVAKLNDTSVLSSPLSVNVLITPSYALNARVTYFFGDAPVAGVVITAANASATTGEDGSAQLENINRKNVDVTAAKTGYDAAIDLLDVLLLLKYLVGDETLNDYQLIAADVNNDGNVTEMDAVMILRKLVELEDSFTSGAWRFVPATKAMELAPAAVDVVFIAILMGDVNGSWGAAQ